MISITDSWKVISEDNHNNLIIDNNGPSEIIHVTVVPINTS